MTDPTIAVMWQVTWRSNVNPKQTASLKAAIEFRLDEADRAAAIAVSKATATAVYTGGGHNSSTALSFSQVVGAEADKLVDELRSLYTAERSKLIREDVELRTSMITAINQFFDLSKRFSGKGYFVNSNGQIYDQLIEEERRRDLLAMRDHFRRPGIKSLPERFPLLFGGVTLGSVTAAIVVGVIVKTMT